MAILTRKAKVTLGYQEGKPTVFKAQQVVMPIIKFDDLCEEVAARSGVSQAQTRAVVNGLVDSLGMFLKVGHTVSLGSLGALAPRMNVKCVKTAEEVTAETIQRLKVQFISGKALRESVKNGGVRKAGEQLDDE